MKLNHKKISDLIVIKPRVYKDMRGYFYEAYKNRELNKILGYKINFIQENISFSKKNVFRGLHSQKKPFEQNKLVKVLEGEILDICVDIRKKGKDYLKHFFINLSSKNKKLLFIPCGFAHGFLVLSKYAKISYLVDNLYSPENEIGFNLNDPKINIKLPINKNKIVFSKKDKDFSFV